MRRLLAGLLATTALSGCGGNTSTPAAVTGCKGLPTAARSRSFLVLFGSTRRISMAYACAHFGSPQRISQRKGGVVTWIYGNGVIAFKGDRPVQPTSHGALVPTVNRPGICRTSQLKIAILHSFAGLGQAGAYIGFTNKSRAGCKLAGWPRLVAIKTSGKTSTARDLPPSAFPATTAKIPALIVKLSPGRRADAAFDVADGAATRCPPPYRWLRVTPPGNTKSVLLSAWVQYLGAYLPDCSAIIVSPVVPPAFLQKG